MTTPIETLTDVLTAVTKKLMISDELLPQIDGNDAAELLALYGHVVRMVQEPDYCDLPDFQYEPLAPSRAHDLNSLIASKRFQTALENAFEIYCARKGTTTETRIVAQIVEASNCINSTIAHWNMIESDRRNEKPEILGRLLGR